MVVLRTNLHIADGNFMASIELSGAQRWIASKMGKKNGQAVTFYR